MEYTAEINGLEVHAVYPEETVEKVFRPLLAHLQALRGEKQRRILVMLAAPPAAGKSTLCQFLSSLARVTVLGMDGFHRRQEDLLSHTIRRDGKTISLVEIKGAPETFDLPALREAVRRVAKGEVIGWPVYNRLLHNPVENAFKTEGDILLLEGNYLLLDLPGWRELHHYADYTVSIEASPDLLRKRLIERKVASGTPYDKAVNFVEFSDLRNAKLCLEKTLPADLMLQLTDSGAYIPVNGKS
ncbi:MAG: nucleoside/nucleotide kinase family protein [Clostridia bacterium]|nr:nucleoside/nucleotide kinase family protein [Clostridia bacterium]